MKLIIEGRLVGLNEYTNACRSNRYVGAKMKADMEKTVSFYIQRQLTPINGKIRLNITWYEQNKKRDLDNIAFAKKFIQDALVKNGIIGGDGWEYIVGFTDNFAIDKNRPRIEVDILEA